MLLLEILHLMGLVDRHLKVKMMDTSTTGLRLSSVSSQKLRDLFSPDPLAQALDLLDLPLPAKALLSIMVPPQVLDLHPVPLALPLDSPGPQDLVIKDTLEALLDLSLEMARQALHQVPLVALLSPNQAVQLDNTHHLVPQPLQDSLGPVGQLHLVQARSPMLRDLLELNVSPQDLNRQCLILDMITTVLDHRALHLALVLQDRIDLVKPDLSLVSVPQDRIGLVKPALSLASALQDRTSLVKPALNLPLDHQDSKKTSMDLANPRVSAPKKDTNIN